MEINIVNGSVEYDGVTVLSEINFQIHEKEKIALVGRNGCGKTTLLKAIMGEVPLVAGTGEEKFGYYKSGKPSLGFLKQVPEDTSQKSMEEEVLEAYTEITETEKAMEAARVRLEKDSGESAVFSYANLQEKYEILGGYDYKREYLTAIRKFGFEDSDLKKPLSEFSGGQRTKIAFIKLLLSRPDILLLDEPTNHLDIEAIEWLETYLGAYSKSCVIVSHDRMFLDRIVNFVYEIEYGETTRYKGNYTSFMAQKKAAYDKALKDSQAKKKEIERLTALVERFRYKAGKAAFAQAKLTQLKRMGEADVPRGFDTKTFHASFQPVRETVEKTVVIEDLEFGYDKPLGKLNMLIKRGEKVGIVGRNGCGKSTLVKTIMHMQKPLGGESVFGLHAEIGYFDQTMTQSFSEDTVFEDFRKAFPSLNDREIRTALGAFLFTGEDVFKQVKDLSGGEKVRLALCKIFKKRPNILILDEPTNHMDIIGKETLEQMLEDYKGTVITVSHDRYFINRICSRLIVFEKGDVEVFEGNYSQYENSRTKEAEGEEGSKEPKKPQAPKKAKPVSASREKARIEHRIMVLEEKIEVYDNDIAEIKKKIEDPQYYSSYSALSQFEEDMEKLKKEKEPLEEEWGDLMEELDTFEAE